MKCIVRSLLLFGLLVFGTTVFAQDIEKGMCLFNIEVSDFEGVPEANAKITITKKSDPSFKMDLVCDVDGKADTILAQGDAYHFRIAKGDTAFHFDGVNLPVMEAGYMFNQKFQIKINESYQEVIELAVHFSSNSAEIPASDRKALDEVYKRLEGNPVMTIELASHTDNVGSEEANFRLSQRRSDSVKAYLVSKGIEEIRIVAKGYGESDPITSNETEEGRARNRRTEVRIVKM